MKVIPLTPLVTLPAVTGREWSYASHMTKVIRFAYDESLTLPKLSNTACGKAQRMKLSFIDYKNGSKRVNPLDTDTIRRINAYNSQVAKYRFVVSDLKENKVGMVIMNLILIPGITFAHAWHLWSFIVLIAANAVLFFMHENKLKDVRNLPGYPKFPEINIIYDEEEEFKPEKREQDELDKYMEEVEREDIRKNTKIWTGE